MFGSIALLGSSGCKPVDDINNANVIQDASGIKVELTYSNSATDPTAKTDLDLIIKDANGKTVFDDFGYGFDEIEILPNSLNDGTYNIFVYVSEIDRSTNYVVQITGLSSGKTYSESFGPINANDAYSTLSPQTITVTGSKFKLGF